MLTNEEVNDHLIALSLAFDPESPFRGMINMESPGGLLTLPIPEQHQVRNAMDDELVKMVFGEK